MSKRMLFNVGCRSRFILGETDRCGAAHPSSGEPLQDGEDNFRYKSKFLAKRSESIALIYPGFQGNSPVEFLKEENCFGMQKVRV